MIKSARISVNSESGCRDWLGARGPTFSVSNVYGWDEFLARRRQDRLRTGCLLLRNFRCPAGYNEDSGDQHNDSPEEDDFGGAFQIIPL